MVGAKLGLALALALSMSRAYGAQFEIKRITDAAGIA